MAISSYDLVYMSYNIRLTAETVAFRKRLTPSLASGQVFEEGKGQKEIAAKEIDNLRASAESTVAGREPNLNLRLLVLEDDGFVPRQVTLF